METSVSIAMTEHRLPKRLRLLRPGEFERVFAAHCSASNHLIALHGAANQVDHPRLGLAVSRRVGGAVQRNRWKRVLREAFRLTQHDLPPLDFVCVPCGQSPPTLSHLVQAIAALAARIQSKIQPVAPGQGNHT